MELGVISVCVFCLLYTEKAMCLWLDWEGSFPAFQWPGAGRRALVPGSACRWRAYLPPQRWCSRGFRRSLLPASPSRGPASIASPGDFLPQRGFCWRRRFADQTKKKALSMMSRAGTLPFAPFPKGLPGWPVQHFCPGLTMFLILCQFMKSYLLLLLLTLSTYVYVLEFSQWQSSRLLLRYGLPCVSDWPEAISSGCPQIYNQNYNIIIYKCFSSPKFRDYW